MVELYFPLRLSSPDWNFISNLARLSMIINDCFINLRYYRYPIIALIAGIFWKTRHSARKPIDFLFKLNS